MILKTSNMPVATKVFFLIFGSFALMRLVMWVEEKSQQRMGIAICKQLAKDLSKWTLEQVICRHNNLSLYDNMNHTMLVHEETSDKGFVYLIENKRVLMFNNFGRWKAFNSTRDENIANWVSRIPVHKENKMLKFINELKWLKRKTG